MSQDNSPCPAQPAQYEDAEILRRLDNRSGFYEDESINEPLPQVDGIIRKRATTREQLEKMRFIRQRGQSNFTYHSA